MGNQPLDKHVKLRRTTHKQLRALQVEGCYLSLDDTIQALLARTA